jgi:predicted nuclease of restriction endonuclease-like (RecB) superfamily
MRAFAEAWPDPEVVQGRLAQLPWWSQIALLEKLKTADQRLWYAAEAITNGWSRDILALQIDRRLHERAGKAITNFALTMPPEDSDLAQQAFKDPYVFDFLDLTERSRERELESGLIEHVHDFLIELGQGFAFVGRQVRLEVGRDEFYCDLLFYHLRLRRYIVIELKAVRFEPGFLGQLGMYMAAVDDLLAHPDDEPTIGLLLCQGKNNIVAEWAVRGYKTPIGVADWTTALTTALPEELSSSLPSIEELEAELSDPPATAADR